MVRDAQLRAKKATSFKDVLTLIIAMNLYIDCPKVQDIGRREKYNEEYYFRTLMYSFYR